MDNQVQKELPIAVLSPEVEIVATSAGLLVRYLGSANDVDLSYESSWSKVGKLTRNAMFLAQSVEQLIQLELVDSDKPNLLFNYRDLRDLGELSSDFLEGLIPWAPFSILVQAKGVIGTPTFQPLYKFMLGKQHSFPTRMGPFLSRADSLYRLSPSNYELVEEIDAFNDLSPVDKNKQRSLLCVARIKELIGSGALDDYLDREGVLIPQRVKIDIFSEGHGFISLYPSFDGVPSEAIRNEFFRLSDVQKVYDLQIASDRRLRVLLPDEMIPILKDLQRYRRVGGATRDRVVGDVMNCFSDGVNKDLIDVVDFAPRVKGICSVPERAQILINAESRDWAGIQEAEGDNEREPEAKSEKPLVLDVSINEESEAVPLSFREFRKLASQIAEAQANDSAQVEHKGRLILIDDSLTNQIRELEKRLDRRSKGPLDIRAEVRDCQVLDIHQNFESTSYSEGNLTTLSVTYNKVDIPRTLRSDRIGPTGKREPFALKTHQQHGVLWLQNLFSNRDKRRGCLLADDMGLGKTLQVLTFLAWCIESGYRKGLAEDTGPYEPILIVAPIILLENWRDEMQCYFQGDVFEPCVILYGSEIKQLSLESSGSGRETKEGLQKLDIDRIRDHRVVITNYDTVKNYQHSLAKVPWSVIVTDEAQEFKIQNQKSDALKALKAHFRIVATGTPVENRLLDLWNLVDFMHPGSLLGSAKEFHNKFEKDIDAKSPEEKRQLTGQLRNALYYDRPDTFVLRRDKESQLTDFPKKIEHRVLCEMPATLKSMHFDIVKQFTENSTGQHFALIDSLKKLYLHPRLLHGLQPIDDPKAIISESPKLQNVIAVLEKIRSKGEKVLIFAVQHDLQTLLSQVLGSHFGIKVEIISGATDSKRKGMLTRRKQAIKEFEAKDGFNILILSLKVAGVGLTITGANHVIHFERWWNPAKEAQATDRAYRIGQKKDVNVYYFIATDSSHEIVSFDEKLDRLLAEKQELAKDFLIPRESEETIRAQFADAFVRGGDGSKKSGKAGTGTESSVIESLSQTDQLSPRQFEALIGLHYRRKGFLTVLCPLTGDGGADLVVVGFKELFLIQCKHSSCMTLQSVKAISDLEDAPDHFRREVFSGNLLRRPIQRVAWTNSRFDQDTKALAARCQIELRDSKDVEAFIKKEKIGLAEILEFETGRTLNLKEVKELLRHT